MAPDNLVEVVNGFRLLNELPGVTVMVFDPELRFQFLGGRGLAGLRLESDQMLGRTVFEYRPERTSLSDAMARALSGNASQIEFRPQSGGVVRSYLAPLHDGQGRVIGGLSVSMDVSDFKAEEERLRAIAFQDPLTGLTNRRLFDDRLAMAFSRVKRERQRQSCLFWFDIDDFKTVNDCYGHPAGDQVLVEVAKRLTAVIRSTDTAARIGGDEFAVLCDQVDPAETQRIAGRFRQALDAPHRLGDIQLRVGASFGMVVVTADRTLPDILEEADRAMYAEKARRKR